jgi:hypothetical protein
MTQPEAIQLRASDARRRTGVGDRTVQRAGCRRPCRAGPSRRQGCCAPLCHRLAIRLIIVSVTSDGDPGARPRRYGRRTRSISRQAHAGRRARSIQLHRRVGPRCSGGLYGAGRRSRSASAARTIRHDPGCSPGSTAAPLTAADALHRHHHVDPAIAADQRLR